jgi:hypothetical protein
MEMAITVPEVKEIFNDIPQQTQKLFERIGAGSRMAQKCF